MSLATDNQLLDKIPLMRIIYSHIGYNIIGAKGRLYPAKRGKSVLQVAGHQRVRYRKFHLYKPTT